MLTTTLSGPKTLEINVPADAEPATSFIDTSTITIIPLENQVAYYSGQLESEEDIRLTNYNLLRSILIKKQNELQKLPATFSAQAHKLHVIIKPDSSATFGGLVNIIDEMLINEVKIYTITDISDYEAAVIKKMKRSKT